ncbi:uncharacterized protein LOC144293967 isoform X5 [Canis aureus]
MRNIIEQYYPDSMLSAWASLEDLSWTFPHCGLIIVPELYRASSLPHDQDLQSPPEPHKTQCGQSLVNSVVIHGS